MSKARDIADLDFNSPDIDGGNIDGATIGATTPAAGTFGSITATSATFNGDLIANGNLRLYTTDDQAQQWYIYTHTDDTLRFNYNGSGADALTFDTSENVTFAESLTTGGTITSSGSVTGTNLRVNEGSSLVGGVFKEKNITGTGDSNDLSIFAEGVTNGGAVHFMTGGSATKRVTIDGAGRMGVGTSVAPHQKLTITGTSGAADGNLSNGILALTTGTGVIADTRLLMGIVDDSYAWLQAADYGVAYRDIALNPNGGNVGIGMNAASTGTLAVQSNSGAGGISIVGRSNGGIGGLSFYDDNGSTSVGYIQGRADDTQMRMWGSQTGGNLSFATQDTERLRITNYGGVHARNGHLGCSYTTLDSPDRAYWTVSTFNDNATVTSGTVGVYTSNTEWQPVLLKITATSINNGQGNFSNGVFYVRIAGYHGGSGLISTVDSWTSGTVSVSVTATDINEHHMRIHVTVTGQGNRTVASVEALSYGGVFETARTG